MAVYFCGFDPSYVPRIGKHSPRNFRERESRMTIRQLALQLRIILPVFSTLLFSAISYALFCLKKKTRKDTQVDDYHGTKVADPYCLREDNNSAATPQWVERENKDTITIVTHIPF